MKRIIFNRMVLVLMAMSVLIGCPPPDDFKTPPSLMLPDLDLLYPIPPRPEELWMLVISRYKELLSKIITPDHIHVVIATTNPGLHIMDLTTGQEVLSVDLPGTPVFGVIPFLSGGEACLNGYGLVYVVTCFDQPSGKFIERYRTLATTAPVYEAGLVSPTPVDALVGTSRGLTHLRWYIQGQNIRFDSVIYGELFSSNSINSSWYSPATPAGGPRSLSFNSDGSRVIIVRGSTSGLGELWFGSVKGGGSLVGSLGTNSKDTRKLRCALPICAVSNRSGLLNIIVWDGTNAPTIIGTIPGSTGAVGIDVAAEGANFAIRNADYDNNTVTKTIVNVAGGIISSVTKPVPDGCKSPGHVTSLTDTQDNQVKTVVSCNGVNADGKSAMAVLSDALFF